MIPHFHFAGDTSVLTEVAHRVTLPASSLEFCRVFTLIISLDSVYVAFGYEADKCFLVMALADNL